MRRFLAMAIIGLGLVGGVACGGGDGERTFRSGDGEVQVSDDLPSEFPKDFPIYSGSKFLGSVRGESEGIEGFVATWETGDGLDDVKAFFDKEFAGTAWKASSSGSLGAEGAFYLATNGDESKVAYVYISRSGEEDKTTILATVGDNDGTIDSGDDASSDDGSSDDGSSDDGSSDDGSASGGSLPSEVSLSSDYPTDSVPLPDGAHVTSSSSITAGGMKSHYVEFYSEKSIAEITSHFKDELAANGWTESFETEVDGEQFLSFAKADGEAAEGIAVSIANGTVDGYRYVTLTVSVAN